VIGAFLFILGVAVAWNGYGYVQIERGWTLVISGTVAFSTGLLLIALGFVLRELRAVAASASRATLLLAKARTPQAPDFEEAPQAALQERIAENQLEPEEAPTPFEPAPEPTPAIGAPERPFGETAYAPAARDWESEPERSAERTLQRRLPRVSEALKGAASAANPLAWMIRPEKPQARPPIEDRPAYSPSALPLSLPSSSSVSWPEPEPEPRPEAEERLLEEASREDRLPVAEPEASPPEPEDLSGSLDAPEPAPAPDVESEQPAPESDREPEPQQEPAPQPEPTPELAPEPEPARDAAPAGEAPDKEVIGHYDAQGAHYIMYADGSIDAETVHGVYRFASMEELKQFIERQS
jgi:hypothetical protein